MLTLPTSSILTLADDVYLGLLIYYLRMKGFSALLWINGKGPYTDVCECFHFRLLLCSFSPPEDLKHLGSSCMFCKTNCGIWNSYLCASKEHVTVERLQINNTCKCEPYGVANFKVPALLVLFFPFLFGISLSCSWIFSFIYCTEKCEVHSQT